MPGCGTVDSIGFKPGDCGCCRCPADGIAYVPEVPIHPRQWHVYRLLWNHCSPSLTAERWFPFRTSGNWLMWLDTDGLLHRVPHSDGIDIEIEMDGSTVPLVNAHLPFGGFAQLSAFGAVERGIQRVTITFAGDTYQLIYDDETDALIKDEEASTVHDCGYLQALGMVTPRLLPYPAAINTKLSFAMTGVGVGFDCDIYNFTFDNMTGGIGGIIDGYATGGQWVRRVEFGLPHQWNEGVFAFGIRSLTAGVALGSGIMTTSFNPNFALARVQSGLERPGPPVRGGFLFWDLSNSSARSVFDDSWNVADFTPFWNLASHPDATPGTCQVEGGGATLNYITEIPP